MISTEIYIEDYKLDLLQDISTEFTYTVDDVADFGSKNTSYSKTINLSGTARNNQIFGFVFDMGNANLTDNNLPNVNYNFNASKAAQCRIFIDKVQIFKGTLRIMEIVIDKETIEYQCSVFGELGGLITALGNKKLTGNDNIIDNLDFSTYDHTYSISNITKSWEISGDRGTNNSSAYGSGYAYPLIDYGNVSTNKVDFKINAFRPALFVKEYIDKIFAKSGYTYNLDLNDGDQTLYDRLIIPHNQLNLTTSSSKLFKAIARTKTYLVSEYIEFDVELLGNFEANFSSYSFTYYGTTISTNIYLELEGVINNINPVLNNATINLYKSGSVIGSSLMSVTYTPYSFSRSIMANNIILNNGDVINVYIQGDYSNLDITAGLLEINSLVPTLVKVNINENITINDCIPKGILQRDFFLSVAKMFNLYIYDDLWDDKKILMKPYVNFYSETYADAEDWTNKIDRSKPLSIKPMSELNARYFNYKFKEDNDFYGESYRKKYNEGYGDRIYDTQYDFSKDTDVLDVIFSSSVLFALPGTDKLYPAIYKLSDNNTKEARMDSNIRIMQFQKKTGISNWAITKDDASGNLQTGLNTFGFAGHLHWDDTLGYFTNDINFGAPKEIQFVTASYPTTNLFNAYYSTYMAEITSKDSKLLTCNALLNTTDIMGLNFTKYVWLDGILFRLNKVEGFNPMEYNTTKINLLKVIETKY